MSDDVLQNWAQGIAEAEMMSDLPGSDPWADPMHCIRDLAAALRAIRIERDKERMAGHIHSKAADELAQTVYRLRSENDTLQTRIAKLEAILYPSVPDPAIDAFYLDADKEGQRAPD